MIQKLPSSLSPYWSSRGEISLLQGLLLKGPRLIIPSSMRLEILDRIHDGHQGIVSADAEPRTQFGGQVWVNNWKRWSLTVANVLSIENPTANQ